jgi:hypothetical protein
MAGIRDVKKTFKDRANSGGFDPSPIGTKLIDHSLFIKSHTFLRNIRN